MKDLDAVTSPRHSGREAEPRLDSLLLRSTRSSGSLSAGIILLLFEKIVLEELLQIGQIGISHIQEHIDV